MLSSNIVSEPSEFVSYDLNCKKNIAFKFTQKIVALFTENYPSEKERMREKENLNET